MRVVSWNMGMSMDAYADVHERAWHFLVALDPDIALLQECRPPDWIREWYTLHSGPFQLWVSAVLSKGLSVRPIVPDAGTLLAAFNGYLATAALDLPDGQELVVASVHATAKEAFPSMLAGLDADEIRRPSVDVPWMNDVAYLALKGLVAEKRFIVGGDWNIARLFDDVYGAKMGGREFFDRAAEDGWVECQWKLHGAETQTWLRDGDRPYQLDHIFCDAELGRRLIKCEAHAEEVDRLALSDHAPLVVDFDLAVDAPPAPQQPATAGAATG